MEKSRILFWSLFIIMLSPIAILIILILFNLGVDVLPPVYSPIWYISSLCWFGMVASNIFHRFSKNYDIMSYRLMTLTFVVIINFSFLQIYLILFLYPWLGWMIADRLKHGIKTNKNDFSPDLFGLMTLIMITIDSYDEIFSRTLVSSLVLFWFIITLISFIGIEKRYGLIYDEGGGELETEGNNQVEP